MHRHVHGDHLALGDVLDGTPFVPVKTEPDDLASVIS